MELPSLFSEQHKVLVVDDVASARKVVMRLLGSLGIPHVAQAGNGKEALELVAKGDIGFIISDWQMPELDGLGLLKALRENDSTKKIPFIMITATAKRELVLSALELGVSDYVVKPFGAEGLARKINAVLERAQNTEAS